MPRQLYIGTAGWGIPRAAAEAFAPEGSGLQRYASRFGGVEINSTFYRSPMPKTFIRWAASVGDDFRFALKIPKAITHELKLQGSEDLFRRFLDEMLPLGDKRGPYLVQLPPSLAYDPSVALPFFERVRSLTSHAIVCEPRHPSWFEPGPAEALMSLNIARVAADPARVPEAARPGGEPSLAYYRLHGSPRVYYSEYGSEFIAALGEAIARSAACEVWCIFDNTASGAAAKNALELLEEVRRSQAWASAPEGADALNLKPPLGCLPSGRGG